MRIFPPKMTPKHKMTSLVLHRFVNQNERRASNLHLIIEHYMRDKIKMKKVGYPETEEEELTGQSPQEHQMQQIDESEGLGVKIRKLNRVFFYCTHGRSGD